MSVGEELRDPWGWVVAGVSGGVGWAALSASSTGTFAVAAGVGIAAAVLGTKVVVGLARPGQPDDRDERAHQQRPRDRLPEPPAGSAQSQLAIRARRAVARLDDLAHRSSDPWIASEVRGIHEQAQLVADSVAELAGRITLLESSIAAADPPALAAEIDALQAAARSATDPDVSREQQRALAALDAQAESVRRLLGRRDTLLAQTTTATVGLEGLTSRSAELVALGPASQDTSEGSQIVAELGSSLDAMQASVEEARRVVREL